MTRTTYSVEAKPTTFADLGLGTRILSAVSDMGYETPTPVQELSIPLTLQGNDVLAAAQTGTGKTAAFLLPTLDKLGHHRKEHGPLMLVVTPTRELAQQIENVARTICRRTKHHLAVLVGGVSYNPQKAALKRGCDLLIATPGRLIDLINQGVADLSQVETLVLDEADRMLDMGFLPDVQKIVAKCPEKRQTLLFSATLGDDVTKNTKSLIHNPVRVEIAHKGTAAETVEQFALAVTARQKLFVLEEVLRREGSQRVIVFTRGKHRADTICKRLHKDGFTCAPIHGDRKQNQRERALRDFKNGRVDILVATDVLARGIDVPEVSYVINIDVPGEAEDYIHRIGRTGRAGESGWALTFVTEDDYLDLRDAEQLMNRVIPTYPRSEGLPVGEDTVFLDPTRNPKEKLPNKKARKRMARRRAAQHSHGEKGAEQTSPRARKPKRAPRTPEEVEATMPAQTPSASRNADETGTAERHRKYSGDAKRPRRRTTGNSSRTKSAAKYGPGNKPRNTVKSGARRPGDRGGRRS